MEERPIKFEVSYQLREYLSFVFDFLPYAQAAKNAGASSRDMHAMKDIPSPGACVVPLWRRALLLPVACLAFFVKRSKVGTCQFTVDGEGVMRESKSGPIQVPWAKVIRVFRLSQCYLVAKAEGAMPIPYRCLSESDRVHMERILAENGHAAT